MTTPMEEFRLIVHPRMYLLMREMGIPASAMCWWRTPLTQPGWRHMPSSHTSRGGLTAGRLDAIGAKE